MDELAHVGFNTLVIYVMALAGFRLMGQRSVGRLSPFDVLVLIMIGEAAAISIEEPAKNLLLSLVPIFLLVVFQIALSLWATRTKSVEQVSEGQSVVLVEGGQIKRQALAAQRITEADIATALRENQVDDLSQVESLRIEPTGKFSIRLSPLDRPVTMRQLQGILEQALGRVQKEGAAGGRPAGSAPIDSSERRG